MKHRKNHLQIQALCEGAVMLALATVLSLIRLFPLPNGGSVNLGMLPLLFYCLRWGLGKGVLCCTGYALLQLLIDGAYGWGWQSIIFDYLLAFPLIGFAGLFHGKKLGFVFGPLVGCTLRFVSHFISGITAWRILAPTEVLGLTTANPYLYSAVYNGSFIGVDMILCIVLLGAMYIPLKKYMLGLDLQPAAKETA